MLRSTYSPRWAWTRAWSRAALAASSLANPPTHRGLLTPVSGSLTRITYDHVFPRFTTPWRSLVAFLRVRVRRRGSSADAAEVVEDITRLSFQRGAWRCSPPGQRAGFAETRRYGSRRQHRWPAARRACCGRWPGPRRPRARSAGACSRRTSGQWQGRRVLAPHKVPVGDDNRGVAHVGQEPGSGGLLALVGGAVGAQSAEGGGVGAAL